MAAVNYTLPDSAEELGRRVSRLDITSITSEKDCHVYKIRWLMLAIYMMCALADEAHWLHYAITAQTITKYYGVSDYIVDLTATTYGITFVLFVLPAIWLIEKYGLKKMLICGDVMIIAASGLKLASKFNDQVRADLDFKECFSYCCSVCMNVMSLNDNVSGLDPQLFYVGFSGQILAGIAQVFIVNVPSYLAGLWFPKNEVSTACALGVLGLQVGNAFSFFIPPQFIALGEKSATEGVIGTKYGLFYVYIYLTVLPVILLPLLIFVFKSQPAKPPSYARISKPTEQKRGKSSFKELIKNTNYILVVVSYSLNVSVFYCMSTMMNQIITDEKFAGTVGATIVVFGIAGCFFFGWLIDKTHKFKLISLVTYLVSIVGLIIFWVSKTLDLHQAVYILSGIVMGFFLASYVIVSIEFSSELTYPISETISTSILLASGEFLSIFFIHVSAILFQRDGVKWVIVTTSAFMLIGLIPTSLTRNVRLKRHEASLRTFYFPKRLSQMSQKSPKKKFGSEESGPFTEIARSNIGTEIGALNNVQRQLTKSKPQATEIDSTVEIPATKSTTNSQNNKSKSQKTKEGPKTDQNRPKQAKE